MIPKFETEWDIDHEAVVKRSPGVVLTRNTESGRFYLYRLRWQCSGSGASFEAADEVAALAQYEADVMGKKIKPAPAVNVKTKKPKPPPTKQDDLDFG